MIRLAWMLLLPLSAVAAATDDDEARIEVLIQAERGDAGADSETARPPTTPIAPAIAPSGRVAPADSAAVATMQPTPAGAAGVANAGPVHSAVPSAPPAADSTLRFDDLKHHVGETIRIVTTAGKQNYAEVLSADAREVTLRVHQAGGLATYTMQRAQIARIETR